MNMNSIEKIKRSIGKPIVRKLKDDEGTELEFEFHPLGVDCLPDLMDLQSRIGNNPENMLKKENSELLVDLIKRMLKKSFPSDTPDDVLNAFALKFFPELSEVLIELNTPKHVSENKTELLKERLTIQKDASKV